MRTSRERHPRRARRAGFAAALAALCCAFAATPASATVSYVGAEDPAAPARSGNTLTSDRGEWICIPGCYPPSYAWQRCTDTCVTVPGRAGPTYALTTADVGTRIRSVITMTDLFRFDSESRPSAQTSTIAPFDGSGPGSSAFPRMRPFPVVALAGRLRRGRTAIGEFTVRGPRGARVSVRCRGRGCPFRRRSGTIGRRKRLRMRSVERSYPAGAVLEVRVTATNRIGKFTRIRFRSRRAPSRRDLCVTPGVRRPTACP